jgi:HNH endonuclease
MAHPLHEQVRHAFSFRCAYCGVEETAAGAEFTVDHYRPRSVGGTDDPENLVYACYRCNLYKGFYWPTLEEFAAGQYILHPQRDNIAEHIRENKTTGKLEPLTATGVFHINLLDLNRPPLVAHRLARHAAQVMQDRVRLLEERIEQQEETIQFLRAYIQLLTEIVINERD